MPKLSNFFESLYTQFLLRDILAKTIPGFLALSAVGSLLNSSRVDLQAVFLDEFTPAWFLILYGLSFMSGMLVQHLGMRIGFSPVNPSKKIIKQYLSRLNKFYKKAKDDPQLSRQRERLVILKEMAANYGMSLSIILVVGIIRVLMGRDQIDGGQVVLAVLLVLTILGLKDQGHFHAQELEQWEHIVINHK